MRDFTLQYYRNFVDFALDCNYRFMTLKDFYLEGCPKEFAFICRHDLDTKPETLQRMIDIEMSLGIRSTIFVRVNGSYNPFGYNTLTMLKNAENFNFEIGLHTNFVEFSKINNMDSLSVLESEIKCLRSFFDNISSISTHRDLNYVHNSLPFIEKNWDEISSKFEIIYQAYDKKILESTEYVNEGFSPHLSWRNKTPDEAILKGKSIYCLTHSHWWYDKHPFELWQM